MTTITAKTFNGINKTAENAATSALKARNAILASAFVRQTAMAITNVTTMFYSMTTIADSAALLALMKVHAKMASASLTCAVMAILHVA